ncbi:MAG: DUF167 domain-containing protein [Solirubrobacteraceae bacterium]
MSAGTRLRLRVAPGAARSAVVGRHGEGWKLRVDAAPEQGRANEAVVRLLAQTLAVTARDVAIVSGHGTRDKIVTVTGLAPAEIERRLTLASGAGKDLR